MNTTAIAVLAEAGIRGIAAEAALRCVLAELAAPSETSRRTFRDLGLDPAQLDPSEHRIAAIVRRLADAGLDHDSAHQIFTDRCAPAVLILVEHVERLETAG